MSKIDCRNHLKNGCCILTGGECTHETCTIKEPELQHTNQEIADNSRACCNCANGTMAYPNCYCWQHKYCNGDKPYKIPKEVWLETAERCEEFELDIPEESDTPEESDVCLELHRIISEEIDNAAEKYTDNPDNYAVWTEHFGDFATVDDIELIKRAFKAGVAWATRYNNKEK